MLLHSHFEFETKSGTHSSTQTNYVCHTEHIIQKRNIIQSQIDKDNYDEQLYKSIVTFWCVWKYRKESTISMLPKDVLKLITYDYILDVRNIKYKWITHTQQKIYKESIIYFVIILMCLFLQIF